MAKRSEGVRRFFTAPIKGYQYISAMLPGNCRYYPTCSEYAKWQFEMNRRVDIALASSIARILRCNQLFAGGIDYPIIRYTPPSLDRLCNEVKNRSGIIHPLPISKQPESKISIKYWIIPKDGRNYYLVKDFDE